MRMIKPEDLFYRFSPGSFIILVVFYSQFFKILSGLDNIPANRLTLHQDY